MSTTADRNLAAEERAVEEGHRAYLADGALRVVSDRIEGLHYLVGCKAAGSGTVLFTCQPEEFGPDRHAVVGSTEGGHTPCKHAALAARRLERAGILAWVGGIWVLSETEQARLDALYNHPADPFKGLPQ